MTRTPPVSLLQTVADGRLQPTSANYLKMMRYRAFIQPVDHQGALAAPDQVERFQLSARGRDFLESAKVQLKYRLQDPPPPPVRLWISALKRLARNCPPGVRLGFAEGQLQVLTEDSAGTVKNDDAHRLATAKVPWVE
jgi:hypothetical protein